MAKYKVFRLNFKAPLHIGLGRDFYDSSSSDLHSDTISSALGAMKAQRGATSEEIRDYLDSLTISSAFPFESLEHSEEVMYFLPRPLSADTILLDGKESVENRKKLKKAHYIESTVWKDFVNAGIPSVKESQIVDSYIIPESCTKFYKPFADMEVQRVQVPRDGEGKAEPFYFEWRFFNSDSRFKCGLYFIIDAPQEIIEETKSLLQQLGESGLGTDKTIGGGQFEVEEGEIDLPDAKGHRQWVSLSLYLPSDAEQSSIDMGNSCYNIQLRGGYMAGSSKVEQRHLWKKSIYMFDEGSVFSSCTELAGKVVNLKPEWNSFMHPVYRSGKALFIPVETLKSAKS